MYHFVNLAKLRAPLQQSKAPKSYISFLNIFLTLNVFTGCCLHWTVKTHTANQHPPKRKEQGSLVQLCQSRKLLRCVVFKRHVKACYFRQFLVKLFAILSHYKLLKNLPCLLSGNFVTQLQVTFKEILLRPQMSCCTGQFSCNLYL